MYLVYSTALKRRDCMSWDYVARSPGSPDGGDSLPPDEEGMCGCVMDVFFRRPETGVSSICF